MKVNDLLELVPQIVSVNIDIRNNGRYNYKYVMGEHIQLHDGYTVAGTYKHYELESDERLDFNNVQFPATFWAIDPRKAERKVLELEITDLRIWQPSKGYLYGKPKGWQPLEAIITCDVGDEEFNGKCTKSATAPKVDIYKDQMSINDFLEGVEG